MTEDEARGPADEAYWRRYYEVTAERLPWTTTRAAADAFGAHPPRGPRFAVDLGCGAGRDARELLRRGWRVLAADMTADGPDTLRRLTPEQDRDRLETVTCRLEDLEIPACDLVNANLVLPFLAADDYAAVWERIRAALPVGGRFSGMLFGHRDDLARDAGTTCPRPDAIRRELDGFDVEHWSESEEDGQTALGEDHHFHLIEVVAVRRDRAPRRSVG